MDGKKGFIHAQRIRTLARIVAIFSIILIAPSIFTAQVQAWEEPVLYAGVSNPASVYRYAGDTTWTLIGTFPEDYAVLCLVDYQGELYAGTMSNTPHDGIGRVYRYTGGTTWTLVGDGMDDQVACLVVYNGNLYAGTAWSSGRLYRFDGGTTWTMVVDHEGPEHWAGFRSAHVYGDILVLGDIMHHLLGHYDGTTFTYDAFLISSCEGYWDFEAYNENLYASAGHEFDLAVSSDGTTWSVVLPAGWPGPYVEYKHVWELETFGDKLFMGLDNGTLQTWDGSIHSNVLDTPDGEGITAMETSFYYGKLFLGVGEEAGSGYGSSPTNAVRARIYSYDGTTFQLISGEIFGTGIQVLYERLIPNFVIPEIPFGTITALLTILGAFGVFLVIRKN